MIVRLNIDSDCEGTLQYTVRSMGQDTVVVLPKYRTRLSEYDSEQLIQELQKDPTVESIYLYKITYPNGQISLLANPNKPIGKLECNEP